MDIILAKRNFTYSKSRFTCHLVRYSLIMGLCVGTVTSQALEVQISPISKEKETVSVDSKETAQLQTTLKRLNAMNKKLADMGHLDVTVKLEVVAAQEKSLPAAAQQPTADIVTVKVLRPSVNVSTPATVEKESSTKSVNLTTPTIKPVITRPAEKLALTVPLPSSSPSKNHQEIQASLDNLRRSWENQPPRFEVQDLLSTPGKKLLPQGWPVRQGYVSSQFGWRGRRMHKGVDIVAPARAEVLAVEEGIVTKAGTGRGYGNLIEIQHSSTHSTRYAHNSKNLVSVGDRVTKGQSIALVGSTGRATCNHVHFEVRQAGRPIDPFKYLNAIGTITLLDNIGLSEK